MPLRSSCGTHDKSHLQCFLLTPPTDPFISHNSLLSPRKHKHLSHMHIMASKAQALKINTHWRGIKPPSLLIITKTLLGQILKLLGKCTCFKIIIRKKSIITHHLVYLIILVYILYFYMCVFLFKESRTIWAREIGLLTPFGYFCACSSPHQQLT